MSERIECPLTKEQKAAFSQERSGIIYQNINYTIEANLFAHTTKQQTKPDSDHHHRVVVY